MDEIVSIVGDRYVEPIAELATSLVSLGSSQNDVQTSPRENGYASSLCILAVAWFESWVVRLRYLNSNSNHVGIKQPVEFLRAIYPDLPVYDELIEAFVLRDTLAHNHLWSIRFSWGGDSGMKLHGAQKDAFYGDKKYQNHVDPQKRQTKKLGLNVVPIKVCAADFRITVKIVWTGLEFIRDKDPAHMGIGNSHCKFQGQLIPVREFVRRVCYSI